MQYLVKKTGCRNKIHRTVDGLRPLCGRAAGVVAGQNGWEIINDVNPVEFLWICWHCDEAFRRQAKLTAASYLGGNTESGRSD